MAKKTPKEPAPQDVVHVHVKDAKGNNTKVAVDTTGIAPAHENESYAEALVRLAKEQASG